MIYLYALPNSKIEQAITNLYKTEKNRSILHDRVIGGLTYRELALKYHPEADWWGRRDCDRFRLKVQKMEIKLQKSVFNTAEEGET